ncbi:MAG: hypothetical protein JNM17_32010 [Archangium sp.]|nr:hypothetical protein [Archangium sp.]
MCDWCVKLAPDWGPGLCHECLKHEAPKTRVVRATFGSGFLLVFLALNGLLAFFGFVGSLVNGTATPGGLLLSGVWAIGGIGGAIVVFRSARR